MPAARLWSSALLATLLAGCFGGAILDVAAMQNRAMRPGRSSCWRGGVRRHLPNARDQRLAVRTACVATSFWFTIVYGMSAFGTVSALICITILYHFGLAIGGQ